MLIICTDHISTRVKPTVDYHLLNDPLANFASSSKSNRCTAQQKRRCNEELSKICATTTKHTIVSTNRHSSQRDFEQDSLATPQNEYENVAQIHCEPILND